MKKTNILLVDDDPVNLTVLEAMLERSDLNIEKAASGFEALKLAEETDFALGLIDVQMPKMDGFIVAERIRQTGKNKEMPVIFISAVSKTEQFVLQGYESGAVDYLIKPFDQFKLISKVNIFCKLHQQKKMLTQKNMELADLNRQLQTEIAERKTIAQKLKESETKYRKLFEKSNDPLLITTDKVLDCNSSMLRLLGCKNKARLLNTRFIDLFPKSQPDGELSKDKIRGMMGMAFRDGTHKFECLTQRADGDPFPTEVLMTAIPIGKIRVLHIVMRDITKQKESEQRLIFQAIRDPLTGLFNRRYLEESLEREISKANRHNSTLAIIMFDADRFKQFNDSCGHLAGDLVLRNIGKQLVKYSRKEDIACRYGGEEFVLMMPGISMPVARQRAEDLRIAMETQPPLEYKGKFLPNVTISLGVSLLPTHGTCMVDLMNAADTALYEAKNLGRNQVIVAAKIHEKN